MYTVSLIAIVCGIVVAAWVFFGFISGVGKTFKSPPTVSDAAQLKSQREEDSQEAKRRQRQAMDDMKQRIADGARKKY